GACDWKTTVWLNGTRLGVHSGGDVPFSFEVTKQASPSGNVVVVRAFDDARNGLQQLGKQSRRERSEGIFYTRTTGIWQTVWLEAVGTTFVEAVRIAPDPEASRVLLQPDLDGPTEGLALRARVLAGDDEVGKAEGPVPWSADPVAVSLSKKRLWRLEDPFLHDLELTVLRGEEVVDRVRSYFGLRKVELSGPRFLLNGEPVFQRLVLDQGFYPDGIWTAPSDEALRRDIELSKSCGFNGARLHQKVFEPRFHHWADRLGYLTWGEGPSFGPDYANRAVDLPVLHEWRTQVLRDRNHPSIVGWCPFNESPAEAAPLQDAVYDLVKSLDATRPVIDTSGWTKSRADADIGDAHDYEQDPARFARRWAAAPSPWPLPARYGAPRADRPFFVSEFGGIGWIPPGEKGWGYGAQPRSVEEFHARYEGLTGALLSQRFHFGFCYTQLTDVEQERNGLFSYDRRPKFDLSRIRAATARKAAYESDPPPARAPEVSWTLLVPAVIDPGGPSTWRWTTDRPAEDWIEPGFDDSGWKSGSGGFGAKEGWEKWIRTAWSTPDLWLRRSIAWEGGEFDAALLVMHYDNATRVYLNGREILSLEGWNDSYGPFDVTDAVRSGLRKGENH
ncbi:MAG TPA: glycoside hydrolase family 2 TIM barrel-domain containing protein, partial [Planctomycetota bacterium]|nr:glycoside hydrolase family 2 TIM barrel-domain containing protein [Planctomycetota bacterium]